jgi:hypothetical protein
MLIYLSLFFSGEVDPFWPHVILLSVSVLASFAVGAGIIFESPKYSAHVQHVAMWGVIAGVVVEAACTITLFAFDEGISNAQQDKIVNLETRLASRSLSDLQIEAVAKRLEPFAGQKFALITYWNNPESYALTNRVFEALKKANWELDLSKQNGIMIGVQTGIVMLRDGRVESSVKAADELVAALTANGIAAALDVYSKQPIPDSQPRNDTVTINVGIKQ